MAQIRTMSIQHVFFQAQYLKKQTTKQLSTSRIPSRNKNFSPYCHAQISYEVFLLSYLADNRDTFPGSKVALHEADHPPSSDARVNIICIFISTPHIYLHNMMLRHTGTSS
jgi:hypothetical protein